VVIPVAKPEIAELAKLANNSFRDLTFAFANQVALISEKFNIPVDIVIDAANHGYPRNTIPSASPGVGGYCLTKDPYIMASSLTDRETAGSLGPIAREINIIAGTYPIKAVEKYLRKTDAKLFQADILIIGLAFKGYPETNDVRGSSGVLVAKALKEKGAKVLVWDHVLTIEEMLSMGLTPADDYHQAIKIADILIVMNNHPSNVTGLISDVVSNPKPRLVFDGWSQLNRSEMESITGLTYSTIGYMANLGE